MSRIVHDDCLNELRKIPSNYIDLLVTDPPYGYSFMGKNWDKAVPSVEIWKECLRVLKPGAFAFIMSAPRQDVLSQMIVRIGEAGFDTDFTSIYWTYASGFPKALNIGKAVDKKLGVEREVVGTEKNFGATTLEDGKTGYGDYAGEWNVTKGNHPLEGSYGGFQPKPAVEVIIVAMKPLSEKTYVDQALKNGKGVTWLKDTAIPSEERINQPMAAPQNSYGGYGATATATATATDVRFPANLLVSDNILNDHSRFFSLDEWAQTLPFLAVPKASKGEKNEGVEHFEERQAGGMTGTHDKSMKTGSGNERNNMAKNHHPTVKPLKLMSYLITLGSRENDLILDPFLGSGTTALAAHMLNRQYIGIEREEEYVKIAEARLKAANIQPKLIA